MASFTASTAKPTRIRPLRIWVRVWWYFYLIAQKKSFALAGIIVICNRPCPVRGDYRIVVILRKNKILNAAGTAFDARRAIPAL